MTDFNEIKPGIVNMLKSNMGLKSGESVLIVNDMPNQAEWSMPFAKVEAVAARSLMARKMYDIAKEEFPENKVDYLVFPSVGQHGKEPPAETAEAFLKYDVVLLVTSYSLSHTEARENATQRGARIASMPGIESSMFTGDGPMAVDYTVVAEISWKLADLITKASDVRITTGQGTDLTFSIENRKGDADTGILDQKGFWGNLPGGEAFTAPVEGSANGKLVVPKGWYFGLEENMTLTFRDGYAVSLEGGGKVGEDFAKLLAFGDESLKHRRNCAELGIGTNPKAKKPDNVLEAEKIKGTVHVAVGDSSHVGGVNPSDLHEDFILPEPTLYFDGKKVDLTS